MDQPNLKMKQCRCLDVVKDYDYKIMYHPGKANEVVDALSWKATGAPNRDLCLRLMVVIPLLE